jgi:hypothetical protein
MTVATAGREAQLAQQVIAALHPHFTIATEVWGTHPTGKRLRIDAIAVPRDVALWARPDIALGIEFKAPTDRPEERRDRKDNAKIISQCIDYSLVEWDGYGRQPIFFCPGFTEIREWDDRDPFLGADNYREGFRHGIGYMMAGVMGQNNVGELFLAGHLGWAFLMNGSHRIWSERIGPRPGGVGEGKRNRLIRSVGSR